MRNRFFNFNSMGTLMKKLGSILLLTVILTGTSHAAIDPLKRGLQLYKKNHYEDAIRLLYSYLPAAENHHQAKTNLGLGMICLANARLYRDLYQAALETNLDYFKRLLAVKGPSASQMATLYMGLALLEDGKPSDAAGFFNNFLADRSGNTRDRDLARINLATALYLQNETDQAHKLWSKVTSDQPSITTALAAAYRRVGIDGKKQLAVCQRVWDRLRHSGQAPSIQTISNLIYVYAKEGRIDETFELIMKADLIAFFHEEVPVKNKVIRFYDAALLGNLSLFYGTASLKFLQKARSAPDSKISRMAQYYLGQAYGVTGDPAQSARVLSAFISAQNNPPGLAKKAGVRQAFNQYLLGDAAAAKEQLNTLLQSEPSPNLMADMLLACIEFKWDVPEIVIQASAMAQKGHGRPFIRINFALGKYYLWKQNFAKAVAYMEAGRDKSNKNRIEFNDPLILVNLAQAYGRTKQFSEALEIFFEMSKQFPAVRQIQVALQGVYIIEQKSAGDVKIF